MSGSEPVQRPLARDAAQATCMARREICSPDPTTCLLRSGDSLALSISYNLTGNRHTALEARATSVQP